jgi:protein-tyrosine phosphatase
MKRGGLHTLVSLLEPEESNELGLSEEQPLAERIGLTFVSFPIPDRHVPTRPNAFREFVFGLAIRLRAGERVGMHCRGSIGRATVTAACTLIEFGWEPEKALNAIEAARGCPVPDTPEQREWILRYKARS